MKCFPKFAPLILLLLLPNCKESTEDLAPEQQPVDYPEILDETFLHQGNQRRYILHIPDSFDGTTAAPLVIFLHGGGGNAESAQNFTNFNTVSDESGFIMAYPQAFFESTNDSYVWADGRGLAPDKVGIDDVDYINSLTISLLEEYNIDPSRVYLCGFSNGSFLTQRIAFESNELYAAMGTLGGTMSVSQFSNGNPGRAIPMMYVFGTEDPLVPYEGGLVSNNPDFEEVVSVEAAVDFWIENNECDNALPPASLPDIVPNDNSTVTIYEYVDGINGSSVIFYRVEGAGHTWPGVAVPGQESLGATNLDFLASRQLWQFFSKFEL